MRMEKYRSPGWFGNEPFLHKRNSMLLVRVDILLGYVDKRRRGLAVGAGRRRNVLQNGVLHARRRSDRRLEDRGQRFLQGARGGRGQTGVLLIVGLHSQRLLASRGSLRNFEDHAVVRRQRWRRRRRSWLASRRGGLWRYRRQGNWLRRASRQQRRRDWHRRLASRRGGLRNWLRWARCKERWRDRHRRLSWRCTGLRRFGRLRSWLLWLGCQGRRRNWSLAWRCRRLRCYGRLRSWVWRLRCKRLDPFLRRPVDLDPQQPRRTLRPCHRFRRWDFLRWFQGLRQHRRGLRILVTSVVHVGSHGVRAPGATPRRQQELLRQQVLAEQLVRHRVHRCVAATGQRDSVNLIYIFRDERRIQRRTEPLRADHRNKIVLDRRVFRGSNRLVQSDQAVLFRLEGVLFLHASGIRRHTWIGLVLLRFAAAAARLLLLADKSGEHFATFLLWVALRAVTAFRAAKSLLELEKQIPADVAIAHHLLGHFLGRGVGASCADRAVTGYVHGGRLGAFCYSHFSRRRRVWRG